MINLNKPIWFYDDRAKSDDIFEVVKLLWKSETHALCEIAIREYTEKYALDVSKWPKEVEEEPILLSLDDGHSLNSDYDSWIATNDLSWWRPFGWDGD